MKKTTFGPKKKAKRPNAKKNSEPTLEEMRSWLTGFEPAAESLNCVNAVFLSTAALCAYRIKENDQASETVFKDIAGFNRFVSFPKNGHGTEGFLMASSEAVVVSFCGTNQFTDWLTNLRVELIEVHGVLVHKGFWEALAAVWADDAEALVPLKREVDGKRLWFCGHSLGGALSLLATLRCKESGIPVQGVYTFGQPLVGEGLFRRKLQEFEPRVHRFVNDKDPVPLVPLKGFKPLPESKRRQVRVGGKKQGELAVEYLKMEDFGNLHWLDLDGGALVQGAKYPKRSHFYIGSLYKLAKGIVQVPQHDMAKYAENMRGLANTSESGDLIPGGSGSDIPPPGRKIGGHGPDL